MATDNDLSVFLPDPPPPRPARRDAAIEEALRRFDAQGEDVPVRAPMRDRPAPARSSWGRPQIAAFASVALVMMVSVPVWWANQDVPGSEAPRITQADLAEPGVLGRPVAPSAPSGQNATEPPLAQGAAPAPVAPALAKLGEAAALPPPPVAAQAEAADDALVVTGSRIQRQDYTANSPTVTVDETFLRDSSNAAVEQQLNRLPQFTVSQGAAAPPPPPPPPAPAARSASRESIVVTGSQISRATAPTAAARAETAAKPGDWNECTVADPERDVAACRAQATRAGGTQLSEGLAFAWRGEFDRAIAAFTSAIADAPTLSAAYLNRGLAYQAKGDLPRALADLNAAVSRDPNNARVYFHRSKLYRARGQTALANADADRAIRLDPSYRAVLP